MNGPLASQPSTKDSSPARIGLVVSHFLRFPIHWDRETAAIALPRMLEGRLKQLRRLARIFGDERAIS
jgi:hypothetical protein